MARRETRKGHRQGPRRESRVWPIVGILGLLVAGLITFAVWAPAKDAAVGTDPDVSGRLVAAQTVVDLGRVPFDKSVEVHFELANTGGTTVQLVDRLLFISQVRTNGRWFGSVGAARTVEAAVVGTRAARLLQLLP